MFNKTLQIFFHKKYKNKSCTLFICVVSLIRALNLQCGNLCAKAKLQVIQQVGTFVQEVFIILSHGPDNGFNSLLPYLLGNFSCSALKQ